MAKTASKKPAFASLNPEDMIQGGLPSDFRGVVTEAVYVKWDYDGSIETPALFARLTIQPAEGEDVNQEPIVQHYSAGDLRAWVPADEDGDEAEEGPYAKRAGKKAEMSRTSNFAHLMETILESGSAAKGKPFTAKQLGDGAITCLVGLDAHWDRVPQKVRSGMTDIPADADTDEDDAEEKPKRNNKRDILVVTEVFGYDPDNTEAPKATKKKVKAVEAEEETADDEDEEEEAPVAKKKKAAVVEDDDDEAEAEESEDEEAAEEDEEEESPLDAELSKAIAKELKAAGGTLKKGKLAALVLKAFAASKSKSKAVNRVAEEEFLGGKARPWTFNEDTGVLKSKK